MSKRELIRALKDARAPVVICGAGVVGEALLGICRNEGIAVECFCDSSERVVGTECCGLEVVYTPALGDRFKDATVLISVAAIKDVVDLLERIGISSWHAGGVLLKDIDIDQDKTKPELDYVKFAIENCILCHDGYLDSNRLFLRSIDLIITERCSLRCRECSNLAQYYDDAKDLDTAMLLRSIDTLSDMVDEVMDFRVLGGDAFMNKEWPVIVERLVREPRARRVVIYTNGTIMPRAHGIPLLRSQKVLVVVTDYGALSRRLADLRRVMQQEKIAHHVIKETEWLRCSTIAPRHRTAEENAEMYARCCAKNMLTLSSGKLFRCPYAANAARLMAVPDFKTDYIDLFELPTDGESIGQTRQTVQDYVLNKGFLDTCDFCNGRPLFGETVDVAAQAPRPLPYRKYGPDDRERRDPRDDR